MVHKISTTLFILLFFCISIACGQGKIISAEASMVTQGGVKVNIISNMLDTWELDGNIEIDKFEFTEFHDGASLYEAAEEATEEEVLFWENFEAPAVQLASFAAAPIRNAIEVEWTATTEKALNYFLVQRSNDMNKWNDVGIVLAPKEINRLISYTYTDDAPYEGTNYYRLKQVDTGGHADFSDVIAIERFREGYHITNLYPHPGIFGASIDLHLHSPTTVNITLRDQAGEMVGNIYSAKTDIGQHTIEIDLKDIPEGAYICQIEAGSKKATRTITK